MAILDDFKKPSKRLFKWWVKQPETLTKLEEAYRLGCTDKEACSLAGISERQLYYFQTKYPEFVSKKQLWQQDPTLRARRAIVASLDDPQMALKYLERKRKEEFGISTQVGMPASKLAPLDLSAEARKRIKKYE